VRDEDKNGEAYLEDIWKHFYQVVAEIQEILTGMRFFDMRKCIVLQHVFILLVYYPNFENLQR